MDHNGHNYLKTNYKSQNVRISQFWALVKVIIRHAYLTNSRKIPYANHVLTVVSASFVSLW